MKTWKQRLPLARLLPSNVPFQRALDLTPPHKVKVILLGNSLCDNHNGLVFSTHPKAKTNPQHNIIFSEYRRDLGFDTPRTGDLTAWAEQGVLMLPVRGYELFVYCLLRHWSTQESNSTTPYLLWCADQRRIRRAIDKGKVLVATAPSPINISYGNDTFTGCSHFSETNRYLEDNELPTINWRLR